MITIDVSKQSLLQQQAIAKVLFVAEGFSASDIPQELQKESPVLAQLVGQEHFTGKSGTILSAPIVKDGKLSFIVLVGTGTKQEGKTAEYYIEQFRRLVGKVIRTAESHRWYSVAIKLPQAARLGISDFDLGQQTAESASIAAYTFFEYITDPERKSRVTHVTLVLDGQDSKEILSGIERGKIISEGVNETRRWIDLPPVALTPIAMVDIAREVARKRNLKITVFDEKQINQMGMGGLSAVAAGSERDAQFAILEYQCGKSGAPTLGFVGKGITFDSGGLSIKPAESMETMKDDMAGAAAVLASMDVLAQLKPCVNIVGFLPLTENLPSGKATKPGDIVTFYNGKTAEVKNTDAEGRLILADALSYAEKHYKLDAIVDLATLTGACAYALGPYYSGLMSNDEPLVERLMESSGRSGDTLWRLPLTPDYMPAIRTPVADIANIGSSRYRAGAITAGLFLSHFVEKTPWAHIDIAGTAFNVPDKSYFRSEGATGVGVRLLVDLALHWK